MGLGPVATSLEFLFSSLGAFLALTWLSRDLPCVAHSPACPRRTWLLFLTHQVSSMYTHIAGLLHISCSWAIFIFPSTWTCLANYWHNTVTSASVMLGEGEGVNTALLWSRNNLYLVKGRARLFHPTGRQDLSRRPVLRRQVSLHIIKRYYGWHGAEVHIRVGFGSPPSRRCVP